MAAFTRQATRGAPTFGHHEVRSESLQIASDILHALTSTISTSERTSQCQSGVPGSHEPLTCPYFTVLTYRDSFC